MARKTVLFALCCLLLAVTDLSYRTKCEQADENGQTSPADIAQQAEDARQAQLAAQEMSATQALARRERLSHDQLLEKIEEAKALLRAVPLPTRKIGGDNAVLAIWNPVTCGSLRLVTMLDGICKSSECNVTVVHPNGVNSQYQVNAPSGGVVIALKTNVKHPKLSGASMPVVYAPFSPAIRTGESIRAGREYLLDLVKRGSDDINDRDVRSLLDPHKRPTNTIPWKILMTLLVVEHVNPDDFDRDGIDPEAGKVLTVLATNREDAYRYAVSYAKARGLAQFIESTYVITRHRYPKALLPEDFVQGMTNHENAVCAQFCLADWSLTRLPESHLKRLQLPQNQEDLGAFLAAAYNGGEEKAAQALIADPANWEKAGHGLFPQTVKYVEIFRATYRYLFP